MEKQVTDSKLLTVALDCSDSPPCVLFLHITQLCLPGDTHYTLGNKVLFMHRVPGSKPGLGRQSERLCVDHSLWEALFVQDRSCGHLLSSYLISPNGVSY